jgi:hypothetical protein
MERSSYCLNSSRHANLYPVAHRQPPHFYLNACLEDGFTFPARSKIWVLRSQSGEAAPVVEALMVEARAAVSRVLHLMANERQPDAIARHACC